MPSETKPTIRVIPLQSTGGDERGLSAPFALPADVPGADALAAPFELRDAHVMTLEPGHVRGNHFHRVRHEVLLMLPLATWSFHWDSGEGTEVQTQRFEGDAAAVLIPPNCSHAIRNDGQSLLYLVGLADLRYDPDDPDVFRRAVV